MADTPTVYVICDQNCKFEGMTKEQIMAAIMQAVNEGTISDIDAGFITTIKTINGVSLKFFYGEQAAYNELSEEQKTELFAIITNDTFKADVNQAIQDISTALGELQAFRSTIIKNNLRGNSTGFNYQWIGSQANRANLDNITFEGHYFVIFGKNIPSGCYYGFLDVDYFDGTNFSPHGGGFEKSIKQTFRNYDTNDIYQRTFMAHSGAWTAWECLTSTKYIAYIQLSVNSTDVYLHFIVKNQFSLPYTYAKVKTAFADNISEGHKIGISGGDGERLFTTVHRDTLNNLYFGTVSATQDIVDHGIDFNFGEIDGSSAVIEVKKVQFVPLK